MCGICGFIGFEDKNLIKKMNSTLHHRGPDDNGYYYGENATLGHRRLSIIDLESGHQPIHNEEENIFVVFNGEIYNYLKLRSELEKKGHDFYTLTDTEVLVHLYEEFGINFLDKLDGMFSFAIWDDENQILLLSRDRIGKKPLYYTKTENGFLFASEIKAILEYNIEKKLNYDVLSHFLTYRSTPNSETFFENIKKVLPGSVLSYNNNTNIININKYYNLHKNFNINFTSEEEIIDILRKKIIGSVEKRLMSDVPLGAYLSGGIDSSTIVAIASKLYDGNKTLKTFSVGFGVSTDELENAKETASYFGTDHRELYINPDKISNILPKIIWHLDEPIADPAIIPVYLMSELTKKHVSVVLTGEGADELFAGYPKYKLFSDFLRPIPDNLRYKLYKYSPPSNVFDEKEKEKLLLDKKFIKNKYEKDIIIKDNKDIKIELNDLMKKDMEYWLPNYLLMKVDKMTMAHGLEARAPFLDNELIELSLNIPVSLKVRNLTGKYILRKAMANILPKDVVNRKKRGFPMPLNNWLKGDLKELLIQNLYDSEIIKDLFHEEYIDKILKGFESSINPIRKMRLTIQAWTLLTFSIWYDIYLK